MALSKNELRGDKNIALSEKDVRIAIACRFCDEIFYDNKSLLNHFQSHFHHKGAYNGRLLFGSFMPPGKSSSLRFGSQPTRALDLRSRADMFTSESTATRSLPIAPGTSGPSLRTRRFVPQTGRRNKGESCFFGHTKPYINQLDRPIQNTIVVTGGNNCPEIDLTLKL